MPYTRTTYKGLPILTPDPAGTGGDLVQDAIKLIADNLETLNAVGVSGYSGYSGTNGVIGVDGASGYSGRSGSSGYSGYSGLSGHSGYSGRSGYSGFSGYSGRSGATGFQGISGYSGYSGETGPQGPQGDPGPTGPAGADGASGAPGANTLNFAQQGTIFATQGELDLIAGTGITITPNNDSGGVAHYTFDVTGGGGADGASGYSGFSGYSGRSGYSGFSGYSGATGATGTSGFSGYSGKSGFSGYSGTISAPTDTDITLTDGSTTTWDQSLGDRASWTVGGARTLAFSNNRAGTSILRLIQDGTGSRTVTWPASVKWPGGTAPTLTTTPGAVDVVSLYSPNGTTYYAVWNGAFA